MLGRIKNAKPEEEITVTAGTETKEVLPSSGKTIKKATVNPTPSQAKSVTPSASQKIVTPDSGKLLNKVTVNGDSDLVAGNIKKGVDIFGVTGTFDGEEIVNGIIEEYYTYYNDISPNTFVEYIGELSYAYSNAEERMLASQNYTYFAPIAIQLNDNTVIIASYSSEASNMVTYVALTFDMNNNTITPGTLLQSSFATTYLQSDYVHLVKINDNSFALFYFECVSEFRDYTAYVKYDTFSVSSNIITSLQKSKTLYTSNSSRGFTSSNLGISAINITNNYLLVITPTSYESVYTGSIDFRIIICNFSTDGTLNVVTNYDYNLKTVTNIRTLHLQIVSNGFSLCKISPNKYIWVAKNVDAETYYFFLIEVSADYNIISITYVTDKNYNTSTSRGILYLSKNLTENNYCYLLYCELAKYGTTGTPKFSTIYYNVNTNSIVLGTIVTPPITWVNGVEITWVMTKGVYGMFGSSYRAGTPTTDVIYGHRIGNDGVLTFITVAKNNVEIHSVAQILPLVFNTQLNKALLLQLYANRATLYNVYIEPFNVVKRIKESTSEIFGLTKTKCKVRQAGKVWVLNKTTEV